MEVWDLLAPAAAAPLVLQRTDVTYLNSLSFDPTGDWLVTTRGLDAAFWPLDESLPRVLAGHRGKVHGLTFTPDGKSLVSASFDGTLVAWPLSAEGAPEKRILLKTDLRFAIPVVDSASRNVLVTNQRGHLLVVPLSGTAPVTLAACDPRCTPLAVSDGGRLAAVAPAGSSPVGERWVIEVFDIETRTRRTLRPLPEALEGAEWEFLGLQFLGEDQLLASQGDKGLFLFSLTEGTSRLLAPQPRGRFVLSRDGRFVVGLTGFPEGDVGKSFELVRLDLKGGRSETLTTHGTEVSAVALDPTDTLVATGSIDGTVRIGSVSGDEPYVFQRHKGQVWSVAFSPDGRFLASAGDDRKILLWPVPDLSEPPLQERPYQDVLSLLRSRTNLRVVPDPGSPTGWKLDRDPFPGWVQRPAR